MEKGTKGTKTNTKTNTKTKKEKKMEKKGKFMAAVKTVGRVALDETVKFGGTLVSAAVATGGYIALSWAANLAMAGSPFGILGIAGAVYGAGLVYRFIKSDLIVGSIKLFFAKRKLVKRTNATKEEINAFVKDLKKDGNTRKEIAEAILAAA